MIRVLVFSPTPTFPADFGNRKRVYSVCDWFKKKGAEVHFAYYPFESDWRVDPTPIDREEMINQWDSVDIITPKRERIQTVAESYYHHIDEWWDESIADYIKWKTSQYRYDAVIVNYPFFSKVFDFVPYYCLKILDAHDRFSGRRELLESMGVAPEFFYTDEYNEKIALERANVVWAIKEEERQFFSSLTSKATVKSLIHAEVKNESTDVANVLKNIEQRGFLKIGFIGANNSINMSNFKRFLDVARPIFRRNFAPLRVHVYGSICDSSGLNACEWVQIEGRVGEIEEFYNSVDLVIVPMDQSTGLKIKVGEALSFGAPLICHEHAFEGYPITGPYQTLESFEAIALECVKVAYDRSILIDLAKDSVSSYIETCEQFNDCLESTFELIQLKSPRVVIKARGSDLTKNNLTYYYLHSYLSVLAERCSVLLVLEGDGDFSNIERELIGKCLIKKEDFYVENVVANNDCDCIIDLTQGQEIGESRFYFVNNIKWMFPITFSSVGNEGRVLLYLGHEYLESVLASLLCNFGVVVYRVTEQGAVSRFEAGSSTWVHCTNDVSSELKVLRFPIAGVVTNDSIPFHPCLEMVERANVPFYNLITKNKMVSTNGVYKVVKQLLNQSSPIESSRYHGEAGWQWLWDLLDDAAESKEIRSSCLSLINI